MDHFKPYDDSLLSFKVRALLCILQQPSIPISIKVVQPKAVSGKQQAKTANKQTLISYVFQAVKGIAKQLKYSCLNK